MRPIKHGLDIAREQIRDTVNRITYRQAKRRARMRNSCWEGYESVVKGLERGHRAPEVGSRYLRPRRKT